MKQSSKLAVLLMAAVMAAPQVLAQGNRQGGSRPNRQNAPQAAVQDNRQGNRPERMSCEDMAAAQAARIADELAFDDATTSKFVETYSRCQKEMGGLCQKPQPNEKAATKTEASIKQEIEAQFERDQKMLDLRQKYYKEYSKFLTQKQIARVYQLEKQPMKRQPQCGQPGQPQPPTQGTNAKGMRVSQGQQCPPQQPTPPQEQQPAE